MSYLFHFIIVSLQKIGGMGAMSREIPGADKDG